jgi:uncharacterized protein (TIGR01777 family)
MKVAVTGATGFIGSALVSALRGRGDDVTVLTRAAAHARGLDGVRIVEAELETPGAWTAALTGQDAIVHLAGAPIGGRRWTAREKQLLRDSRVESTRTIVEAIAALAPAARPRALVTASGVDYYALALDTAGFDDDPVTERDPPADTFLGRLCRDWEHEAEAATASGVRVASMRTGLVLAATGGALARMRRPFALHVGGRIGSGRQFVSWIHRDDVVAAYVAAIADDRYAGAFNLVASSVRNADFSRALARAMHRSSWLPVPAFAVRAAIGELAEYVLGGRNVVPARLDEVGFPFARRELADAFT